MTGHTSRYSPEWNVHDNTAVESVPVVGTVDHSLDRATATACRTLKDVTGAARPDGRMAVA
eukprot:43066-Prymnesium_polylepis.1